MYVDIISKFVTNNATTKKTPSLTELQKFKQNELQDSRSANNALL